jgi:hypothetical protein
MAAVDAHRLPEPLPIQRRLSPVAALTVPTSARSATAVAEWSADAPQHVLAQLGVLRTPFTGVHRAPDGSTFRRILACVDADALDDSIGRRILASWHGRFKVKE